MKKKILFVDDEPIRAESYARKWEVRLAHGDSQIAFQLRHHRFDLIMLDHDMPMLNGISVIRMFWESFKKQNCPIIIHSANDQGAREMQKMLQAVDVEAHTHCLPDTFILESYLGEDL